MAVLKPVRTVGVDSPVDIVSLADLKGELEETSGRQDSRLQRIVSAVTHSLEEATGGPIGRVTQRFEYSAVPKKGDLLLIEARPVKELTAIGYVDADGNEQSVAVTDVRVSGLWDNPLPAPNRLVRVANATADGWDVETDEVTDVPFWVDAEVGWDPMPPMAQEACIKVCQQAAIHRAMTVDFEQFDIKSMVQTFINMYRRTPPIQFVGAR